MKKTILILGILLSGCLITRAQLLDGDALPEIPLVTTSDFVEDQKVIRDFLESVKTRVQDNFSSKYTPGQFMLMSAKYLLDIPYVGQTLEVDKEEDLVVNLRELDCMTFVENCLALSRAAQYPYPDYDYFIRELKYIRYREGIIKGYTSRLHYTSDWITDNVNKGVIEDITHGLGGEKFQPHVYFMSSHPELYPALKNNPQDIAVMVNIENKINLRSNYYYIPKNEIKEKQSLIKDGDIVCFTTTSPGLDISHLGIAYWFKDQLTFIHASSKYKKVIINPESLLNYCMMIQGNSGIIILRSIFDEAMVE